MDALKSKGQMYDQIDLGKISRSGFDLSWNNKGTGKIGRIIPTRCTEVLPGDRFKGSSAAAVQFEPLAVPILANMDVRQEHFYVPNNILWRNWDKFITGGQNLDDTSVLPTTSLYKIMMALFNAKVGFPAIKLHPYWNVFPENPYSRDVTHCDGYLAYWSSSVGDGVEAHVEFSRANLTAFGKKYGCLDLLKPQFEVLDKILDIFRPLTDPSQKDSYKFLGANGNALYGIPISTNLLQRLVGDDIQPIGPADVSDSRKSDFWSLFESMSANTIVSSLIPSLKSLVSSKTDVYVDFPLTCYTEVGYQLFNLFYDFYSSFVGVGSNLDYLNMSRVSMRDMYMMLLSAYVFKKSNISYYDVGDNKLNYLVYESIGSFDEADFSNESMSVLPLRANYAIWYNYYRDQLLETLPSEPSDLDTVTETELLNLILPRQRCWAKDTFTTALANTGTGSMIVPIDHSTSPFAKASKMVVTGVGSDNMEDMQMYEYQLTDGTKVQLPTRFLSGMHGADPDDAGSNYYGFSLDMLNRAQRAQKWLQKALIYGNRIQDRLYTSFGVKFLDNRLHLPEFLSSSRQLVQLSVNTNPTTIVTDKSSTVAGDKSANAYAYDKGDGFSRFCEEHGFIMSYLTIMPEATYPYSVSRHFKKLDKFDYAWPEFATIGMDAVYMSELCGSSLELSRQASLDVFGYQGRYYDYKCHQDEEHGELQTTQNMYTFSREFDILDDEKKPKLNYVFVHCWPSLDMFVVDSSLADYFRYDIHHSVAAERPLPVCGMYL